MKRGDIDAAESALKSAKDADAAPTDMRLKEMQATPEPAPAPPTAKSGGPVSEHEERATAVHGPS